MGQLPILEVDDKEMLCQTTAIGRFIAREYGKEDPYGRGMGAPRRRV